MPLKGDTATHVLEYLISHSSLGVTYHGGSAALSEPYDQRDKLLVYVDSDHRGCADSSRSTTGMVIMLKWWAGDVEITHSRRELHVDGGK